MVADFDITDAVPGSADSILDTVCGMVGEVGASEMQRLRSLQTDKNRVFHRCRHWLGSRTYLPSVPSNESDWAALAQVAFWVKRLNVRQLLSPFVSGLRLADIAPLLALATGADACYGLYDYGNPEWEDFRAEMASRFRNQFNVSAIDDDGREVKAHFLVTLASSEAQTPHEAAMEVVGYLAKLWPDRLSFACQGYGRRPAMVEMPYDETNKHIPIRNLPAPQLTAVNAAFRNLVELSFRPKDWPDYATKVITLRENLVQFSTDLVKYLISYFKSRTVVTADSIVSSNLWTTVHHDLLRRPLLPSVAFKPMSGFSPASSGEERYKPWLKAEREFFGTLSNFMTQARDVLLLHPHLGRATSHAHRTALLAAANKLGMKANFDFLSAHNLTDALSHLAAMQREFRNILSPVLTEQVRDLDCRERETYNSLWHLWFYFSSVPERQWSDPLRRAVSESNARSSRVRDSIAKAAQSLANEGYRVTRLNIATPWDEEPVLWFAVDTDQPAKALTSVVPVLTALHPVFTSEDRMGKLMRRANWSHVALVPLVGGKCLMRQAWRVPLVVLQECDSVQSLGVWNFVQHVIPIETWRELALGDEKVRLPEAPMIFARSFQELLERGSYLQQVLDLSEHGREQDPRDREKTLAAMSDVISATTRVLRSLEELFNEFNQSPDSGQSERPALNWAVEDAIELVKPIREAEWTRGGTIPSPNDVAQWSESISELQALAGLIYVGWLTDAYQQSATISPADVPTEVD